MASLVQMRKPKSRGGTLSPPAADRAGLGQVSCLPGLWTVLSGAVPWLGRRSCLKEVSSEGGWHADYLFTLGKAGVELPLFSCQSRILSSLLNFSLVLRSTFYAVLRALFCEGPQPPASGGLQ